MKSRMSSNNVVLNSFGCMLGKYKSCYQRYSLTPIPPSLTPAPPVMAAATAAVAAISTALSALHLTRTTTTTTTYHTLRSLSSHRLFSSSPSTTSQFTLKNPLSSSSNADEDSPQEQLSIPWNVHAHRAARYLQAMADVKTQKKEKKKVEKGKVREEPKYSKAARRFYNERFRDAPERLSKVLAASGVASRRHSEELIFEGKVTVNGSVCNTPQTKVDPARDVIYVNGNRLPKKLPSKVYLALNKPKGYICSSGEKEFKSALCLFDDYLKSWEKRNPGEPKPRLFTAGRLDVATTGLIIVTNDGEFAQKISHPSHNLTKEYIATINGAFHKKHLVAISEGKNIDGRHCTPESVELLPREPDMLRTRLRIVVHEGRNHEVRELVKNAGLEIHSLKRTRIGGFRLPFDLGLGKHIELKPNDLKALGWTS